jgi:hypothetical protein
MAALDQQDVSQSAIEQQLSRGLRGIDPARHTPGDMLALPA